MKQRLFIVLIVSMFIGPSLAIAQDRSKGLDLKDRQVPSKPIVLKQQINTEQRIVKASPLVPSAEEQMILEELKAARRAGDRAAARKLQAQLDELHGVLPSAPQPAFDKQKLECLELYSTDEGSSPVPDIAGWVDGDIRINDTSVDLVNPAMASAPDGTLYMVAEGYNGYTNDDDRLSIYESTNRGATWALISRVSTAGGDSRNPSIAVTADYFHVAYEVWHSDTNRDLCVIRYPRTFSGPPPSYLFSIVTDIASADSLNPEICTDYLEYPDDPYIYVTYATLSSDYSPVYFSRSTDDGETFSTPVEVTGGSQTTSWQTKPDIAYGTTMGNNGTLFIAFVKPGWTGAEWTNQIWVTRSINWGGTWDTPVRLTAGSSAKYHPRVSAAHDIDSVMVAYTNEFSSTDDDVLYFYSTDGGDTWNGSVMLAGYKGVDENSAAITVSNSEGSFHVAYNYDLHNIYYASVDTADPTSKSQYHPVNQSGNASADYPKLTISVNPGTPIEDEACIAWADYRDTYYDIYFDTNSSFGEGLPWLPLLLLD